MTIALSLSSFSQAGYFCNVQVVFPAYPDHTTSTPSTSFSVAGVQIPSHLHSALTKFIFLDGSSRTLLPNMLDLFTVRPQFEQDPKFQ
uniref:Uncharacterized protein n=1 Tax=Arundo donax TaxID=35708 RepID=A0A0A9DCB5_ARUDO